MSDEDDRRPIWQEVLLLVLPVLITEGVMELREHFRRERKRRKKQSEKVSAPRA